MLLREARLPARVQAQALAVPPLLRHPSRMTAVAECLGTPGDQGPHSKVSPAFLKFSSHNPSAPPPPLMKRGACTALTPQSSPGKPSLGRGFSVFTGTPAVETPSSCPRGGRGATRQAVPWLLRSKQLREPGFRGESPDPQTPPQALQFQHKLLGWALPLRVPRGAGTRKSACLCEE